MYLADMTGESLAKLLNVEVPDEYVIIAKHQVAGFETDQIAEIVDVSVAELQMVIEDSTFKAVKALVTNAHAQQNLSQTEGWDALENIALQGLVKRAKVEKDPEFLLKLAAVANRATRKQAQRPEVLDSVGRGTTTITLTTRMAEMLQHGQQTRTITKELSITDGSMGRATFEEVDSLLNVRAPVPQAIDVNADPTQEQLLDDIMNRTRRR